MARSLAIGLVLAFAGAAWASDPSVDKKHPRPLADLVKDLSHKDRDYRIVAAYIIRDWYKDQVPEVLPQLLAAIGDEHAHPKGKYSGGISKVEQALLQVTECLGSGRVKAVQEATHHREPLVRAGAYRVLLSAGLANEGPSQEEIAQLFFRGAKDEDTTVRSQAAQLCRCLFDAPPKVTDEVVTVLAKLLEDRTRPKTGAWAPAAHAASMLTGFKGRAKSALPALIKSAAKSDDLTTVNYTCWALNSVARAEPDVAREVVDALRPLVEDKKRPYYFRLHLVHALNLIGPEGRWAVPELAEIIEDAQAHEDLRGEALFVLGNYGPRAVAALPTLVKRLGETNDPQEQRSILVAFERMGPVADPAVEAIEKFLKSGPKSASVVVQANKALASILKK